MASDDFASELLMLAFADPTVVVVKLMLLASADFASEPLMLAFADLTAVVVLIFADA